MIEILQKDKINKIWENYEKNFLEYFFKNENMKYPEIFVKIKEKLKKK